MDIDVNDISIINNISHLSLEQTNSNSTDMSFIDTMKSLSINNPQTFEPIETYYDYDRSVLNTDTHTYTHTYVESQIEDNSVIDEVDDFHEYDGYDEVTDTHEYIIPDDESNMLDKYDTSPYICFGIPNKYCQKYFDDEDFIFNRYDITHNIKKYIISIKTNSTSEYTSNFCIGNNIIIDYNTSNDNPDILYAKILYIYTYVNYYYKDLNYLKPTERIKHLPDNLLYWIGNIVSIFDKVINEESLKTEIFVSIEDIYFKELCYGLKIITSQLTLLINHYKSYSLWKLEEKHIKLFFKIVNNMCVIIIFMKFNNRN